MIILRSISLLIVTAVITEIFADNTEVFADTTEVYSDDSVEQAFQENDFIPDVLTVAPSQLVKVTYKNVEVDLGDRLAILDVAMPPEVTYDAELNQNYTLVMIDPDAPSRDAPLLKEAQHWLIVNIPGSDVKKGHTISDYLIPGAPTGSGLHRYTFLVYKQSSYIDMDTIQNLTTALVKRLNFSVEKFAEKYNLGNPVFGNFFFAELQLTSIV